MSSKKFIFISFLTVLYFILGRIIGWFILKNTRFWQMIENDNIHHYQLGIFLLLVSFLFLKRKPELRDYFLAIGSGAIIDEAIFIFKFINPSFGRFYAFYSPVKFLMGLLFESCLFIIFSFVILSHKK